VDAKRSQQSRRPHHQAAESIVAHPFFDSSSYPWHRQDAHNLHRELYTAISNANEIDLLYKSCSPELPPLAHDAPHLMWKAALDRLAAAALLVDLGKHLRVRAYSKAHDAFEQIRNAIDPLREPGAASNLIFVDREEGRNALGRLAKNDVSVLLVRGAPSSGKSWTRHLVKEQAEALGHECIYLCQGIIATVEDTLNMIFASLGAPSPPRLTTEAAWFQKACADMLLLASQKQKRYWVVADDLGATDEGPLLDDLIRQLFDKMALNMLNPVFANRFKLVLIDYPDRVPTKWEDDFWVEDRPTEEQVKAVAVAEFLRRWVERKGKVLPEVEVLKLAEDVIAIVEAPVHGETRPWLKRIHDELSAVLARI
jgi:hypothetical protein